MATYLEPSKVKDLWGKGAKAVRKQVMDFWLNTLFLADEQWVAQNRVTGGIDEIPRLDTARMQLTLNMLRPRSRGLKAVGCGRPLMFTVKPRAADDDSVTGAQIAGEVLDWYYDEQDWEALRRDLWDVTWVGGTGALVEEWDPTAGTRLKDDKTGGPMFNQAGTRGLYTGDIRASVLSIAEFTVAPGTRNAERALWWEKCTLVPPEEAKEMFGLSDVPKADAGSMVSPVQWRMLSTQDQVSTDARLTAVYTYYQRPNGDDSDGQVVVVVGDERVQEDKWPFPFNDRLNLAITRETEVHGRWQGDTVLTSARIPQMGFNQAHSSIGEHMKNAGNARMWVNQATSDMIEELTDTPGEVGVYIGPEKPFWVGSPPQPQWWLEQPDRLLRIIDDQVGAEDVSRGVAPRNVESGLGLSILKEGANSPVSAMVQETGRAFSKFATMVLKTLEVKVTEPRTGYFDEQPEYALPSREFEWTGKDFSGQCQAKVPFDSIEPQSPAQTQAWAQASFDRGAIDLRQFARLMQMPEQERLIEIADPDTAKAQRENHMMSQGQPAQVAIFDDDKKHIEVLNAFRKTERYSRMTPEEQAPFDQHAEAHEQQSIQKMAQLTERIAVSPSLANVATAHGGQVPSIDDTPAPGLPAPNAPPAPQGQGGPPLAQSAPDLNAPEAPGGFPA